jgi:hypothetical protein
MKETVFVLCLAKEAITHQACCFFLEFQGNPATAGCCSKCWRDAQKKNGGDRPKPVKKAEPVAVVDEPMSDALPSIEELKEPEESQLEAETQSTSTPPKKKESKKKASYKSMMAGMMISSPTKNVEKEKEALRKVTGGGAFSKIDKI